MEAYEIVEMILAPTYSVAAICQDYRRNRGIFINPNIVIPLFDHFPIFATVVEYVFVIGHSVPCFAL